MCRWSLYQAQGTKPITLRLGRGRGQEREAQVKYFFIPFRGKFECHTRVTNNNNNKLVFYAQSTTAVISGRETTMIQVHDEQVKIICINTYLGMICEDTLKWDLNTEATTYKGCQ